MADGDLKAHALNSSQDFYELLGVSESASEHDIRRAWRKSALKYHPDKVGPSNTEALEKFHVLQLAQDVLCEPGVRELYDHARRARAEKQQRQAVYEGRRKWMKDDLERRESGALKRKRDHLDAEEQLERELSRLAEDGKRRRKEREEQLRKAALAHEEDGKHDDAQQDGTANAPSNGTPELDRSVTLRFRKDASTEHLDRHRITSLFDRFGPIEEAILRDKKIKIEGEKHRIPYVTAVLVFKSIVGAHAAISDFDNLAKHDPATWSMFEHVGWASGKEPEYVPKARPRTPVKDRTAIFEASAAGPSTPQVDGHGLKRVPSFASFRGTPGGTPKGPNTPAGDEIMMMRLKNAEKRRLEEKIRREEAAAATAEPEPS
ncbi:DnaJ-domain-containing protein [Teratosphaeria nubilosa]|uniref:DnaJ-domain-containing protein n=1 Tax=Teratosphaeria nubilosa TaxID=161662 RepID=A0A6G1L3X7_9PEZI|nr:DnaJ-domain-containing protein [Teratosphaeria nubilosa]